MADVGVVLFFLLIMIVLFINRYRFLDCWMVLSGKVSLEILLCYNRTDTFLVTEFFLTTTIIMKVCFFGFVILLVKLSERLRKFKLKCIPQM